MAEIVHPNDAKTECPFCGNVWQEHTLNETRGCMAILHIQFSAALARDAKLQGKPVPPDREVALCPICGKTSEEHTESDVNSCAAKWRKREEGSTGLELQHTFLTSQTIARGEDPDPLKRAQLQARMLQAPCICGKPTAIILWTKSGYALKGTDQNAGDRPREKGPISRIGPVETIFSPCISVEVCD